jgi:hypothetical protein
MPERPATAAPEPHPALAPSIQKLDWLKAAIIGLTDSEVTALRYIADIDGHTARYMLDVVKTQVPAQTASKTYLTIWNNEEFSNCRDMSRLLRSCGVNLHDERAKKLTASPVAGWLRTRLRAGLMRLMPKTADSLHLAWAASQKFMLILAHEQLAATTANPILRVLCRRIAKQESRNFAWYFSAARSVMRRSGQGLVRFIFENFWYPLSASTQSKQHAHALVQNLFSEATVEAAMRRLDDVMAGLPGFESTDFAQRFVAESKQTLPHFTTARA